MPLIIENNYDHVSLMGLVQLCEQGYSVLKSPHVGNQHPSNLVCAALGIPLEMVSFTQGGRDKNFHPHVRIQDGTQTHLTAATTWTQFARMDNGHSLTEYHQSSVQRVFPHTEVLTDMQRMQQHPALAALVMLATNVKRKQSVWYRRVSVEGQVTTRSKGILSQSELETDVFQFSNQDSGWVIPNKVHMIFDFVYQALSSGRDTIYHLSGPQMVHYIADLQDELQILYDAVRQYIPALPLTLRLRVVPVAAARYVTHVRQQSAMQAVGEVLSTFDHGAVDESWYQQLAQQVPEVIEPITNGTFLSQYDLSSVDDLYLDPWMLQTPLRTVTAVHNRMCQVSQLLAAE